ncbi:PREDICTED: pectin acetylesterase 7-like [Ipomoea nil]|uniref:pectin acetylesterase 7-like n=1 Tax=Ipomoea nil TaxID=35883 RepID=UPI0009018009|nr:PREDICTED: pectin acetylesterase 7-like [Ipomoea nil]
MNLRKLSLYFAGRGGFENADWLSLAGVVAVSGTISEKGLHSSRKGLLELYLSWVLPPVIRLSDAGAGTDGSVPTVIVNSVGDEGAVCLDGTPPAYNWDAGKGEGANNWLLHFQGGGWCLNSTLYETSDQSVQSCASRVNGSYGSSRYMQATFNLTGMLSDDPKISAFYNWNRVLLRYCDGGSFAENAEQSDLVTKHYYRRARIFDAIVKDLWAKGMRNAQNVLLSGGSAGGLGSIIHCDRFRALFSMNVRVKCHADGALFICVKNLEHAKFFAAVFRSVVDLHKPDKALPAECTSKRGPFECFFSKSLVQYLKSPIYFLNSAFDAFQIRNTFSNHLRETIMNHTLSKGDVPMLQDFRTQLISVLPPPSSDIGFIITSLFGHTSALQGLKKPMFVDEKSETFESAFMDWFLDKH